MTKKKSALAPISPYRRFRYDKKLVSYEATYNALPGWHRAGALIMQEYVQIKLCRALRKGEATPLFTFDPEISDEQLLTQFAKFTFENYPAITVVSDKALMEVEICKILMNFAGYAGTIFSADNEMAAPDGATVVPNFTDGDILHISFHENPMIYMPYELAERMGTTDSVSFFGISDFDDLPSPLPTLSDITLNFNDMTREDFINLSEKLFKDNWPEGFNIADDIPFAYIEPTDFYIPFIDLNNNKTGYDFKAAVTDVIQNMDIRREPYLAKDVISLDEMHGMEEAKEIAQNIISDIKMAKSEQIGWDDIDRAILFSGAEGTGKGRLAKTIAKESNVHFISCDVRDWLRP